MGFLWVLKCFHPSELSCFVYSSFCNRFFDRAFNKKILFLLSISRRSLFVAAAGGFFFLNSSQFALFDNRCCWGRAGEQQQVQTLEARIQFTSMSYNLGRKDGFVCHYRTQIFSGASFRWKSTIYWGNGRRALFMYTDCVLLNYRKIALSNMSLNVKNNFKTNVSGLEVDFSWQSSPFSFAAPATSSKSSATFYLHRVDFRKELSGPGLEWFPHCTLLQGEDDWGQVQHGRVVARCSADGTGRAVEMQKKNVFWFQLSINYSLY